MLISHLEGKIIRNYLTDILFVDTFVMNDKYQARMGLNPERRKTLTKYQNFCPSLKQVH